MQLTTLREFKLQIPCETIWRQSAQNSCTQKFFCSTTPQNTKTPELLQASSTTHEANVGAVPCLRGHGSEKQPVLRAPAAFSHLLQPTRSPQTAPSAAVVWLLSCSHCRAFLHLKLSQHCARCLPSIYGNIPKLLPRPLIKLELVNLLSSSKQDFRRDRYPWHCSMARLVWWAWSCGVMSTNAWVILRLHYQQVELVTSAVL